MSDSTHSAPKLNLSNNLNEAINIVATAIIRASRKNSGKKQRERFASGLHTQPERSW